MSETPVPQETSTVEVSLDALRAAGAAQRDPVGWHYIEVLAERAAAQTGRAQALLKDKLTQAINTWQTRLEGRQQHAASPKTPKTHAKGTGTESGPATPSASPLAHLLREMGHTGRATAGDLSGKPMPTGQWRPESPRVRQFRQQLSKISVQKQVTQAIAQAPQNAGPINSHMLVLRSLTVMRDASPDYLNRFMTYLDTLLCLEEAGKTRLAPKKTPAKTPKK